MSDAPSVAAAKRDGNPVLIDLALKGVARMVPLPGECWIVCWKSRDCI
jgi:hypothetical protein